MAKAYEVLEMLLPDGGWIINGDDYEGIEFINCEPITKKQFIDGFAQYDSFKKEQETANANAKSALLAQLGITEEQAKLLLGDN